MLYMRPTQIERRYTVVALLYYSMYAGLALAIITGLISLQLRRSKLTWIIGGSVIAALYLAMVARGWWISRLLRRHQASLTATAQARGWQMSSTGLDMPDIGDTFSQMSLSLLAKQGQRFMTFIASDNWKYVDWSYAVYEHSRNSDYKASDVYYGVMAARLPRVMPNVFFDSKTGRGRQFKAQFAKQQRHSLEGNFDQYFDTYFAQGYTIDGLSFITPDVMEALIAASEYDIEIVQDEVLFYGPMYVDASRLDDMAAKLMMVQSELAHNAQTYRDDRMPWAQRATGVTPQGRFLARRRTPFWPALVVVLVFLLIRIIVSVMQSR
jgi:hypothetical protein